MSEPIIRAATHADLPALLAMGDRFAAALSLAETIGYDHATMDRLFRRLIDDPNGILLVTGGGAAGGLVHPSIFNEHHITGQELFWWVDPSHRGAGLRLLTALEDAARERGAQSFMMGTHEALNFEAATKLYGRRGYRASDRNFIKIFGE